MEKNRFKAAIDISESLNTSKTMNVELITQAIQSAQKEIFSFGGTLEVYDDKAVKLLVASLSTVFNINQLDQEPEVFSQLYDSMCDKMNTNEVDSRRWKDANFALSGSVNVGAICGSIARYANELRERGRTNDEIKVDGALRLIAYQVVCLCQMQRITPNDILNIQQACKAQLAIEQTNPENKESKNHASMIKP